MREVTDWGLGDAFVEDHPVLVIGFLDRSNPQHRGLVHDLGLLARRFEPRVAFRLVDVLENPSTVQRYSLRRLPETRVFEGVKELHRWPGMLPLQKLSATLEGLIHPKRRRGR